MQIWKDRNVEVRCKKIWQVLLDIQSTCDIIINPKLAKNIWLCKWTLILQAQASDCVIFMIADIRGVETVWFFP